MTIVNIQPHESKEVWSAPSTFESYFSLQIGEEVKITIEEKVKGVDSSGNTVTVVKAYPVKAVVTRISRELNTVYVLYDGETFTYSRDDFDQQA